MVLKNVELNFVTDLVNIGVSSYYPGSAILKKSTTQDLYFAMTSRSVGSSLELFYFQISGSH